MLNHPENIPIYIAQYNRVPKYLERPYESINGEEVLNHLLGRNAMDEIPELEVELLSGDKRLIEALLTTSEVWWDKIRLWSYQCGFNESQWWMEIVQKVER